MIRLDKSIRIAKLSTDQSNIVKYCKNKYLITNNMLITTEEKRQKHNVYYQKEVDNIGSMKKKRDLLMLCIFRLCCDHGLRPGEILGLTRNDLVQTVDKETGELLYKVRLRNRLSDRKDQCAKKLRHPFKADHYDTKDFRESSLEIDIDKNMYDFIMQVFNSSRNIE